MDSTNTLGHLTGEILTSLPLGKGGVSPYDAVPTCILQAGDDLFHDEVRGPSQAFRVSSGNFALLRVQGKYPNPFLLNERVGTSSV